MSREDGEALKKEGMDRVKRHADPAWMAAADHCARLVVRDKCEFTADDVRALMHVRYPHVWTHDERAMGPIFAKLAKEGLIKKAPRLPVPSSRDTLHCSPITVWQRGPLS